MKSSLRELFLSEDALTLEKDPLVRLGALHHLHRTVDRDKLQPRLSELLGTHDVNALQRLDPELSIFPLHVAVALAQEGGIEGIQWLLRFLATGDQKHQRLGFTALRNCRQFPFAVLLGSAITASGLENSQAHLGNLITFSDDQAWQLTREGTAAEQSAKTLEIEASIRQLSSYGQPGRRLGRGIVISQPYRNDNGSRFTGFLLVEEPSGTLRGVPYRMSSLINRDDGAASVSARDLVSRPGREVFVVYNTEGDYEAKVVYAIPFAENGPVNKLMARAALSCAGLDIGVVAHKWDTGKGLLYRLITAAGDTTIGRYDSERQGIGSCWVFHESSSLPVSCRISLTKSETENIVSRFIEKTTLERATLLQTWDKGYKLGSQTGRIERFGGSAPTELVVFLEDTFINETNHTFPVPLPLAHWSAEDRSAVLQDFFINSLASYAVVVNLFQTERGSHDALIIHPDSGRYKFRRATPEIRSGTPVFWEDGDNDNVYIAFFNNEVVDANCGACFDTGYCLCETCEGSGEVTCPQCDGSGRSSCGHCDGSGERRLDCNGCHGTGNCGRCGGSATITLDCKICQGTGTYSDSGRACKKCQGKGTFEIPCRVCTGGPQSKGLCPNCEGSGDFIQPCRTCNRTGLWNCDQCRTTGIARCETCRGSLVSSCQCGGAADIRIIPIA